MRQLSVKNLPCNKADTQVRTCDKASKSNATEISTSNKFS
jgi:hypothetical protein